MRRFFIHTLVIASLLFTSSIAALAQDQIRSEKVGLTYTVPAGWRVIDSPPALELEYQTAVTTAHSGVTPNIVITDEVFSGSADEYAKDLTRGFDNPFSTSKLISKSKFKTNAGILGTKVVVRNTFQGVPLRQVFYLFPSRAGIMLILTVTSPVQQGFKHDKVVDETMRKILIEK